MSSPLPKLKTKFKSFLSTPLRTSGDTVFYVDAIASNDQPIDFSVTIYNDLYKDGVKIYEKKIVSSGSFKHTYNNAYTYGSYNEIELTITMFGKTNKYRRYANVAKGTYEYLDKNKKLIAHYDTYRWNGNWSSGKQEFEFVNFDELYMPNFYQKIDLNDFKIKVTGLAEELFSFTGILSINNVRGMFQGLCQPGFTRVAKIPIVSEKLDTGVYSIKTHQQLFVNKQTLQMSLEKGDGYLPTKYIYLPRDEMRYQNEIECSLSLENFGPDGDQISHSFTLKALTNVMGDCHNSEYCIIRR